MTVVGKVGEHINTQSLEACVSTNTMTRHQSLHAVAKSFVPLGILTWVVDVNLYRCFCWHNYTTDQIDVKFHM